MENIQTKINEHKRILEKKTCTVGELAEMLNISEQKARQLTRMEGFPVLRFGRNVRILISELDNFLVQMVGCSLN